MKTRALYMVEKLCLWENCRVDADDVGPVTCTNGGIGFLPVFETKEEPVERRVREGEK